MSCKTCKNAMIVVSKAGETVVRYTHGAKQVVKSKLGIGHAPLHIIEERRAKCRPCSLALPCKKKAGKCTCAACGCRLDEKTSLAEEFCPMGEWNAYNE